MGVSKYFFSCLAGSALLLQMVPSAQAALLVYEPFDYTTGAQLYDQGTMTGLNGGTGWAAAWTGRNGATTSVPAGTTSVLAGSLLHPTQPGDLPTSGGHVRIDGLATATSPSTEPTRAFTPYVAGKVAAASTIWYSFLAQRVGEVQDPPLVGTNPYPRGTNVSMFRGNATVAGATEALGIGNSSNHTTNTWSMVPNGSGALTEGAYNPAGSTPGLTGAPTTPGAATYPFEDLQWVVVRLDVDGTAANDSAYMWLSPDPSVEPSLASAQAAILNTDTNSFNFDGIGSFRPFVGARAGTAGTTGYRPAGGLLLDEVRIGTDYAAMSSTNVVPEPASIALLLLSGLAMVGLRRRS
jgi:hypothetical protein